MLSIAPVTSVSCTYCSIAVWDWLSNGSLELWITLQETQSDIRLSLETWAQTWAGSVIARMIGSAQSSVYSIVQYNSTQQRKNACILHKVKWARRFPGIFQITGNEQNRPAWEYSLLRRKQISLTITTELLVVSVVCLTVLLCCFHLVYIAVFCFAVLFRAFDTEQGCFVDL